MYKSNKIRISCGVRVTQKPFTFSPYIYIYNLNIVSQQKKYTLLIINFEVYSSLETTFEQLVKRESIPTHVCSQSMGTDNRLCNGERLVVFLWMAYSGEWEANAEKPKHPDGM